VSNEPYRAPPPAPPDPYAAAWAELRRRERVQLRILFVGAAYAALCVACMERRALLVGAALFASAVIVAAVHTASFCCPRCHDLLGVGRNLRGSRRCLRCGIAIGTPKSAIDALGKTAARP
jgi:hypothetical protein